MGAPPRSFSAEELLAHAGFLTRLARDLTGDDQRAADVVQATWLAALERPPRSAFSLRSWLATVARNAARNERRGAARRAERELEGARPEPLQPELGLERIELQRVLLDHVLALPAEQRVVLFLRYYEGLTPNAIAAHLAVPVKTVKTRHTRALAELRSRLDERAQGDRTAWVSALLPLVRSGAPVILDGAVAGFLGGLVMNKLALGTGVVLVVVFLWQVPRWRAEEPGRAAGDGGGGIEELLERPHETVSPEPSSVETLPSGAATTGGPQRSAGRQEPAAETGALLVRLSWSDGSPAAGVAFDVLCRNDPAPREERFPATTDASGSALLEQLYGGPVAIDLERGGRFHAEVAAGATTRFELTIPEGVDVEGLVVAPDGSPVSGAEVWVQGEGPRHAWPGAKFLARTAGDGSFRLRDLHANAYLGARAAGHQPSMCTFEVGMLELGENGERRLRLELGGPGGRLRGRVLAPDGVPLAGAFVLAGPRGGEFVDGKSGLTSGPVPVATGPDGGFALPGDLEPGVQPIFAAARGYPVWEDHVEVVEGRVEFVEIRLAPPAAIEGTVRTPAGEPVAGVEVIAAREEQGGWYWHPFPPPRAITAPDGRFRLGWIAPGAREVNASHPEHPRLGKAQRTIECVSGTTSACELVLDPGRTISGHVVDASGGPLAGWTVHARSRAKRFLHPRDDRTDEEGAFLLTSLAEGTHELIVLGPGDSMMTPRAREASVLADSQDVTLVVERIGTEGGEGGFRGVFRAAEGHVPKDTRLLVRPEEGMVFQYVEFDPASGSFAGRIAAGRCMLMALRGRSLLARSAPFQVLAGGTVDVGMFVLETLGRVEIELAGCSPDERARLEFRLDRLDGPSEPLELVEGLLRSGEIAPGRWTVVVEGGELFLRGALVEVRPGDDTRVELVVERGFPVVLACRDPLPRWLDLEARASGAARGSLLLARRAWLDEEGRVRVLLPAGPAAITVQTEDGRVADVALDVGPALLEAAPIPIEPR